MYDPKPIKAGDRRIYVRDGHEPGSTAIAWRAENWPVLTAETVKLQRGELGIIDGRWRGSRDLAQQDAFAMAEALQAPA